MRQPLAGFTTGLTDYPRGSVSLRVVPYLTPCCHHLKVNGAVKAAALYGKPGKSKESIAIEGGRDLMPSEMMWREEHEPPLTTSSPTGLAYVFLGIMLQVLIACEEETTPAVSQELTVTTVPATPVAAPTPTTTPLRAPTATAVRTDTPAPTGTPLLPTDTPAPTATLAPPPTATSGPEADARSVGT